MNLTGFSFNNSRLVMLLVAMLTVAGLGMLTNFPSKEDAGQAVELAGEDQFFPGMSPDRVEDLISRKVEEYIRQIPEVEDIYDVKSTTGVSLMCLWKRFFFVIR